MRPFKEWYESRYAVPYPAKNGEEMHTVWARIAEAVAEYVTEAIQKTPRWDADDG